MRKVDQDEDSVFMDPQPGEQTTQSGECPTSRWSQVQAHRGEGDCQLREPGQVSWRRCHLGDLEESHVGNELEGRRRVWKTVRHFIDAVI